MSAAVIHKSLEHIRAMVKDLTTPEGSVFGVDHKLEIALELCEQLLRDAQDQLNHSKTINIID